MKSLSHILISMSTIGDEGVLRCKKTIAGSIASGTIADHLFISPNFPRLGYRIGAEMGWRQQIKANGLKRKDLFRRI